MPADDLLPSLSGKYAFATTEVQRKTQPVDKHVKEYYRDA